MSKQMEKSALGQKSSGVVLKEITKIFQQPDTGKDFVAVDHINLNIQDGEMVTLLGPSGCGKTTTLRIIGGFEQPDSGDVFFFHGLEKFDPARGAPDENGQHAGCHRVERPAVPDALFMEHAPQLRCHILAGPAVGLVHN